MLHARRSVPTNTPWVVLSGVAATLQVSIDPNRNLTGGGTNTYEWDANDRLLAVKQGGSTLASFTYDGTGRRSTKTAGGVTTTYVYDGSQFLEERPSAGATKRYAYGRGIDRPLGQVVSGVTSYNLADHLGSLVRLTDSAGNPTLTREYDPWGNLLQGSTTGGYAYTGREWDAETQLYYYRARYYDSRIGRFMSEDPIGTDGGLNLFEYAVNRPSVLGDPMGLVPPDAEVFRIDEVARQAMVAIHPRCLALKDPWELAGPVCKCEDGRIIAEDASRHRGGASFDRKCSSGKDCGIYHCHSPGDVSAEYSSTDDSFTAITMFRITRARCRRAVIVLAVIGALLSPRGSSLVQAERPIDVSLIALIGNPAAFDAKLVRTEGFCWLQYDGNGVYVSREDFERGLTLIITP